MDLLERGETGGARVRAEHAPLAIGRARLRRDGGRTQPGGYRN